MRLSTMLVLLLTTLCNTGLSAQTAPADCQLSISQASYEQPTSRYRHGVLGDDIEYGGLKVVTADCNGTMHHHTATLPVTLVFEDLQPRLIDLDGDRHAEIITVESSASAGARLAVWGLKDNQLIRLAATPYIGRAYRWLAPVGAADFDGDGRMEIAYIDRPHLAKTLRVWRYENHSLTQIAQRPGLTNHRIGEDFIGGGVRNCGQGVEMITADSSWSDVMATRLEADQLITVRLGRFRGSESFVKALACEPLK